MTTLRELWDQDGVTYGVWCGIPSVFSAELLGRCGMDWVCVDTQHGLIGYDAMAGMLQGLAITDTPAFVRVPWNQPDHIMKALDAGAQGVVVPMVGSGEEARAAVAAAKYPPQGYRSWGPIRASLGVDGYSPETGNRRTIVALMIETPDGVRNMDEILSVPGVDAIYIGPSDLAIGHGIAPSLSAGDPEHERLILSILEGCRRHGVVAGIHCDGVATVERWREAGFRMLTVGSDGAMLRKSATDALAALRGGQKVGAPSSSSYA